MELTRPPPRPRSAAIGQHWGLRAVWMMGAALSTVQRALVGLLYHAVVLPPAGAARLWTGAALALHGLENLGVFLLSFVGSRDHFALHSAGFALFAGAGLANMAARRALGAGLWTPRSRRLKSAALAAAAASMVAAGYLYWRHNAFCEPYVYSAFALAEYVVIVANVCFHATLPLVRSGTSAGTQRHSLARAIASQDLPGFEFVLRGPKDHLG
jgi:hypothetical protein